MNRTGLFPGTFDPVTLGHIDIIDRVILFFDKIYIGIGINSLKTPMFSIQQRIKWISEIYKMQQRIEVITYEGLTIDFCRKNGVNSIIRGIRFVSDFEYEKAIAAMNRRLAPEIETIFLAASPEYSTVASTLVRDVIKNGGDASPFLPKVVIDDLNNDSKILV